MFSMVRLALVTKQPLSELMTWTPAMVATAEEWLEEKADAAKDAAKGR